MDGTYIQRSSTHFVRRRKQKVPISALYNTLIKKIKKKFSFERGKRSFTDKNGLFISWKFIIRTILR